jgi:TRAP-type mannitol/chloroaromatic compound transport system permease small subunit
MADVREMAEQFFFTIFIVAPCILKIHLLSHTNKCTNYIIYYLKSILIIGFKTLSYFHSSYMFRHITCHPQGALMFLAKITSKTICKT